MKTSGFIDYTPAALSVGGRRVEPGASTDRPLPPGEAVLDNGYVQFRVRSAGHDLLSVEEPSCQGVYCRPRINADRQLTAACTLTVTGQNRFAMPVISSKPLPPDVR